MNAKIIVLIGASIGIVVIASAAWVSIRLVRNNNGNNNNNNNPFELIRDKKDPFDWHSIPNSVQNNEDARIFFEDDFDFEGVDVLMDDIVEDYIISNNNISSRLESEKNKRAIELGLFFCPPPGDPISIDLADAVAYISADSNYHRILLGNSSPGILCTLLEVSTDPSSRAARDLKIKPIGRSYNGGGWEPYHRLYSAANTVPLSCYDDSSSDCLIVLPPLKAGRKYILKSYEHSLLGPRDLAARFLEKTTFGATTSEIDVFVASGRNPSLWIEKQLKLPITSHRQFFRERAINFHPETTWMGTLSSGPCEAGARYRRFVFMKKDLGRSLTIVTSPIDPNYRILMVGGKFRSVIPGPVERYASETNKPVVPNGSYEICFVNFSSNIGISVGIQIGSECYNAIFAGIFGNPAVQLDDQHLDLAERLVTITDGNTVPVKGDFRETEIVQLVSDITDGSCEDETTTGAPEVVTFALIGNEFWIHTPYFRLRDNRLEKPLLDGGKSAVEETANALEDRMKVHCANAPRTFLNEDDCVFSNDACSSREEKASDSGATVVCGSPYEVATIPDPDTGSPFLGSFNLYTQFNNTGFNAFNVRQKESVWLDIALHGKDQLRQRMAWALSQILVVSPDSVQNTFESECFLTYYDIFVRNAFGNYFDILKEVTYSPMMAEMLTYVGGVSTGRAWTVQNKLHHADENYARELLQLFSLGLYRLNDDGTIQIDANGHETRAYKNHDISEYAKVFVGFKNRYKRGNIENFAVPEVRQNRIDPLEIFADQKDHFPKLGMDNRYVGDGYPLCKDLPARNFLLKGATFRLLGSNPNPELLNDPKKWLGSDPVRLSLEKPSILSSILCNKGNGEHCAPMMKVILDSDIECYGVECTVQELRSFEVDEGSGVWYEYVRPPCINHAFFDDAQSIRKQWVTHGSAMCGDPRTLAASTICCDGTGRRSEDTMRHELFSGERVSLDFAKNRCSSSATTQELCDNPFVYTSDCEENAGCDPLETFYWSSSGCSLTAKIDQNGKVAVIHNPQIEGVDAYTMFTNNTQMFFRVDWLSNITDSLISSVVSDCAGFGCTDGDGDTCICPTSIHEAPAFVNDEDLLSVDNVLSIATIGSFHHSEELFQPINGVNGLSKYPHGVLTSETVFKVADSNSQIHFRKNTKSEVHLGTGAAKFRNPVTFYSLSEPTTRDAAYEIDATLHHAFFHMNMAPFIAVRLAQRFGDSNPSPRYVRSISTAFRKGVYTNSSTGEHIGSGRYGCLEATIAAVLLDKEIIDPILDSDPTHGSIQEPYLKIVKVLRSLEFKATQERPLLMVSSDLQRLIGQESHKLPNVFSFFKSEFHPAGRVSSAGMRSPESEVLSGPTSVETVNTIISYLKYGATSCYGGFGEEKPQTCRIGETKYNSGSSSYDPANNGLVNATDIVEGLATLLTSGRLHQNKRDAIIKAYEDTIALGKSSKEAIINAQQLVVASPEFHTTNRVNTIGQTRALPILPESTKTPYKAVIFVMLPGGYDSFNVLVPKTCSVTNQNGTTAHDQYLEQRRSVAFDETAGEFDLSINATDSNQPCSQFAIHDELIIVKELYDAKDLAFFANAGIINNQGLTKHNYHRLTRSQLFAHNAMQHEIAKVDPYDRIAGTGIMGRAKDVLSKNGHVVKTISIDDRSIAVEGMHGESPPTSIVDRTGSRKFARRPEDEYYFDIEKHARTLNGRVDEFSGIFGETWSQQFVRGIDEAKEYQSIFNLANLTDSIWTINGKPNYAGKGEFEKEQWEKWSTISKLINKKDLRNIDRDLIFTELGTWDHHKEMKGGLRSQLRALNYGLEMFVKQTKASGLWDDVAIIIASDFGRTLTPNSNEGTDHGWGGHYMIMGGDVEGGRILGEYPSDLTPTGHLVDDRGRFLPTTSWDSIWNGILEWTGVTDQADLDYCLPNRYQTTDPVVGSGNNFPLLTADSIFRSQESSEGWHLRRRKK